MTSSSYLPHLNHTYTPALFPFAKRQSNRDSFYDSSRPTSRSLSNQTLQTHRSGSYGDSNRGSPAPDGISTTTTLPLEVVTPHCNCTTSPTLKWSITPEALIPIQSPEPKKPMSPSKSATTKIPPINDSRSSPSQSKSASTSHSQVHLQSLINCQSEARKILPSSYSYNHQSRHDFYY